MRRALHVGFLNWRLSEGLASAVACRACRAKEIGQVRHRIRLPAPGKMDASKALRMHRELACDRIHLSSCYSGCAGGTAAHRMTISVLPVEIQ